jgi:hypothetical protein
MSGVDCDKILKAARRIVADSRTCVAVTLAQNGYSSANLGGLVYPVPHRRKKSESQRANAQPTSDADLSGPRFGGVRGSFRACGIERRSKRQGDYLAAGKSPMASRGSCRSECPVGEI